MTKLVQLENNPWMIFKLPVYLENLKQASLNGFSPANMPSYVNKL